MCPHTVACAQSNFVLGPLNITHSASIHHSNIQHGRPTRGSRRICCFARRIVRAIRSECNENEIENGNENETGLVTIE